MVRHRRGTPFARQARPGIRATGARDLGRGDPAHGPGHAAGRLGDPTGTVQFFPVLKPPIHRRGGDLSSGQQQQAIARARAAGSKLLILDEPTEGIKPGIVTDIG